LEILKATSLHVTPCSQVDGPELRGVNSSELSVFIYLPDHVTSYPRRQWSRGIYPHCFMYCSRAAEVLNFVNVDMSVIATCPPLSPYLISVVETCPAFFSRYIDIYLVFSAFAPRPICLLATTKPSVLLYSMYARFHPIH